MYGRSPVSRGFSIRIFQAQRAPTYVSACGASGVWHASRFCCSLGTEIFHLDLFGELHCLLVVHSSHLAKRVLVLEHLGVFLFFLEIRPHAFWYGHDQRPLSYSAFALRL